MEDYEFTSDEVIEVLEEMGLHFDSHDQFDDLMRAVNDVDASTANDSVFIHEDEDDELYFRPMMQMPPACHRPDAQYTDTFLPHPRPRLDIQRLKITAEPDCDYLVSTAYDMIGHMYEMTREIDVYLNSRRRATNRPPIENRRNMQQNVNFENQRPRCLTRSSSFEDHGRGQQPPLQQPRRLPRVNSVPCTSQKETVESVNNKENIPEKNFNQAAFRPVLNPAPGRLPYKQDPVKKMEIVREEWKRNPPINEQNRLKLRWRVREYMLRQSEAEFDPRRPPNPVVHPKDWSPRPYLD